MTTRLVINGSLRKARLLKTGQVISYGSGTGVDDGALQKGIAKSYTVLTTGQYAGTTEIVVNGKTDTHSNNCVLDNNTRLMWSRYMGADVGPASDGLLPWTTNAGGEGIFAYAAAANAANLGGHNDWRIPNVAELLTLVDFSAPSALPDAVAFPSWPSDSEYTWASTTTPGATANSTRWNFITGVTGTSGAKTNTGHCALVRG